MHYPAEIVQPDAGNLVESLRDFGYTLPTALADLIDNSLTANSKKITVIIHAGGEDSHIAVVDDGHGMDLPTLLTAMQMGGSGPLADRHGNDLGRFGLGLKTASLSQGKCLTVITRQAGQPILIRRWDIPFVQKEDKWQLLKDVSTIGKQYLAIIERQPSGTAVIIESLDRASFLRVAPNDLDQHVGRALQMVREHLSMVFHRFIQAGISIQFGSSTLIPWDPYLTGMSTQLPVERLHLSGHEIMVAPYVLPHHSKLTDEQYTAAGGPHDWYAHQGFYIYRCNRLIVPGTWLNLHPKKEEYKLARIAVDLPNSMDAEWHLNVMKSHVAAPAFLRDDLKRIASDARRQAAHVFRFRGEQQAPTESVPNRYVWRRINVRGGVRYKVDRTHPILRSLLHGGHEHEKLLDRVIELIERTVPVASMIQEPAKTLDGSVDADIPDTLDSYIAMVLHAEQFLVRAGASPKDARAQILSAEPFVRVRDALMARLNGNDERNGKETS